MTERKRREPTPWAVLIPFALVWLAVWLAGDDR